MSAGLWVLLAACAMLVELSAVLLVAGYVALGALAAAAASALGAPPAVQTAVFAGGTLVPLLATRRMLVREVRRMSAAPSPGFSLLGRRGVVTRELSGVAPGLVRIGSELWSGRPWMDDTVVAEGTRVEVVDVEELVVLVHPVGDATEHREDGDAARLVP